MNRNKIRSKWTAVIILIILILSSIAVSPVLAQRGSAKPSQDHAYEAIDAYLEKTLDALNVPNALFVVVEGDEIAHTQSFGRTDAAGELPTPQTPFFIGSLTKSFTSLAVMQLVEAGKVELDAPVQRYLPWFTLADPQAAARITVRHLLNQTSGISQVPGMILLSNFDDGPGVSERQARALLAEKPIYPAGSTWEYSNVNYNLLGLIVEAASGETYADYVQEHIYAPLDMPHSYTSKSAARKAGLVAGHLMWFGYPVAVPDLPVPAGSLASGQLISSAEDVAHFLIAQLNGGRYAGTQILSAEGVSEMHLPAAEVILFGPTADDYGMGWFVRESSRGPLVYHYGEVPDFFAYMALLPEQHRAMALLFNANEQFYTYALLSTAETAALGLAGFPLQSSAWRLLPWALRAALLLPLLQIALIVVTLRRVKRWRENPAGRPSRLRLWLLYIALPTILDLILVAIAAAFLASGMLKFMMLFMGDVVTLFLVSGAIALVWLCVRTPLILKKPSQA